MIFRKSLFPLYLCAYLAITSTTPPCSHARAPVSPDFVISGAGPAGLATALELAAAGVPPSEILVLETREFESYATRTRTIVLDAEAVMQLKRLQVTLPGAGFAHVDIHQGNHRFRIANIGAARDALIHNAFGRTFAQSLRISDLEKALLERFLAMGGQIQFSVRPQWVDIANGRVHFRRSDFPDKVSTTRFVFIAEGAKSTSRESLGIAMIPVPYGMNPQFVGLDFDFDSSSVAQKGEDLGGHLFFKRNGQLEGYGFVSDRGGSFGAYLPPGKTETREESLSRLKQMIRASGAKIISQWGNLYSYTGHLYAAESVDVGARPNSAQPGKIFLIGDAARTTDPISANGLNTALRDASAAGRFIKQWKASPVDAELRFVASIRRNSQYTLWGSRTFEDWVEWVGSNGQVARLGFGLVHFLPTWEPSPQAHWGKNLTREALKRITALSARYLLRKVRAPQPTEPTRAMREHPVHPISPARLKTCAWTLANGVEQDSEFEKDQ